MAAAWSAGYLLVAAAWSLGAGGYPYGLHLDPSGRAMSLFDLVPRAIGAPVIVAAMALGLLCALWLGVARRGGVVARIATGVGLSLCVAMFAVGDYRPLMAIARTPVYLLMKSIWGIPADLGYAEFFAAMYTLPVLHEFWQLAGIVIWLFALRAFWRRALGGCDVCGRPEQMSWWATRAGARRWGLIAAIVAACCPLPYAISRYLLALGISAGGFSKEQLDQMSRELPGVWMAGAGLATFGVVGAILTLGLVQRWGERWPFWVPGLRGRSINPGVAIIPASVVSLLLPGASLMVIRTDLSRYSAGAATLTETIFAPANSWAVWGFALAAATLAYWLRRRPDCRVCRRGDEEAARGVWEPTARTSGPVRLDRLAPGQRSATDPIEDRR